ncbi:uncharacterized protein LOC112453410 isoform X2 [Temnothorax curvispinosus]|uniref:Uncharacterized protein LOC112453410 isoform X2 n=1 Tax=Temnothorax curvispinosus TaxID=300111 RepID=A0A6J1PJZ1_9HYME|nr:uncharacterized protein LOC112453410 isoform X2 [Temnothorax curvispinosus]
MICRDFMIRVCCRQDCKMDHAVKKCIKASCNRNKLCKFVHLTEYEVCEINENIRPFRHTVYYEMKRLAYILRESLPEKLRTHACTIGMLGECLWPCLTCETAGSNMRNVLPCCNKCYILLTQGNLTALLCGHAYCKYCSDRFSIQLAGPVPVYYCTKCNKWTGMFTIFGVN